MKKTTLVQGVVAAAVAAVLVACGGGGGAPYQNNGSGGGGTGGTPGATPTPAPSVASRAEVALDKLALPTSGAESSALTVTTVGATGNIVAGVPVTVTVDGGVFTPANTDGKSDASGKFTGTISLGGNRTNRLITVVVSAQGAASVTNQIVVTGSTMEVNGVPSTLKAGTNASNIVMKVKDSGGQAIANQDVALLQPLPAGLSLSPAFPAKTNAAGEISFTLNAASSATVGDTVLGFVVGDPSSSQSIKASRQLSIIGASSGGSGIPDVPAGTVVSSASVDASPALVTVNTVGDVTNKSKITARFLNPANIGIGNVRVRFNISSNLLGAEQLVPNDVKNGGNTRTYTTFTNADGVAEVSYAPGERSSPTDGVNVSACYAFTDAELATNCTPIPTPARLTVGGKPLSISLFDGNVLTGVAPGNVIYQQKLKIQVVDAAGNVVPNADFSALVDIVSYLKADSWAKATSTPLPNDVAVCLNEDANRNGSLDAGEDVNGNGGLDPRKADVSIAFPEGRKTDANGFGTVQVSWGQSVGGWLNYTVTVAANADSSEGTVRKSFRTTVIEDDVKNGSFLTPPYGSGPCTSPN